MHQPMVDLSSFVVLDFNYEIIKHESNEAFEGFLSDAKNPWNIYIGNTQFIPKRESMMDQLQ